jgi:ankyrin repeat protein
MLLDCRADPAIADAEGRSALGISRAKKHSACVVALEAAGAMTTVIEAAEAGDFEMVKRASRIGADLNAVDFHGTPAIHIACARNHAPCVKMLLDCRADPAIADAEGRSALGISRAKKHSACVVALEAAGAMTTVIEAAEAGDHQMITALAFNRADVNAVSGDGWSALHRAAAEGHPLCIAALLDARCTFISQRLCTCDDVFGAGRTCMRSTPTRDKRIAGAGLLCTSRRRMGMWRACKRLRMRVQT